LWEGRAFFREEVGASGVGSEYLKLPDDVEDAMADIASVFHWQPDAMDGMSIEELARWREKARERFEAQNNTGRPPLN
jgi:predicted transcriptional regulator